MRIIHCADLHLDSVMDTNLTSNKAEIRRAELLRTFEKMVEYAKENSVELILIAGDLFDTSTGLNQQIKERVRGIIEAAPKIDFLYIHGNHDADALFCGKDHPDNLKLFGETWTKYNYGNVCIAGREQYATKDIYARGEAYWNPDLLAGMINIVMLHGQVLQGIKVASCEDIPMDALKNRNIDYLALGHIHEYRKENLDERGTFCYCGCLEGRGFDECGKKGFVLLETDDTSVRSQFIPFASRQVVVKSVDVSSALSEKDVTDRIQEAILDVSPESMVKLRLVGEIAPELDIDILYLTQKYTECFFALKIQDCTALKVEYEMYENDISLKGEFIRLVKNTQIAKEDKDRIIRTGIRALIGREFER